MFCIRPGVWNRNTELTSIDFGPFLTLKSSCFLSSRRLGSVFVSRCQDLSVAGPGGPHCGRCSGHRHAHCSVCPRTGLGAELPDPVPPRTIQEQSDPEHQQGKATGCLDVQRRAVWDALPSCVTPVLSATRRVRCGCGGPTATEPNPATISPSPAFRADR